MLLFIILTDQVTARDSGHLFYVQTFGLYMICVIRCVVLTWPGVSPLPLEGRLLLVKDFLGSCGLVSILTSGDLVHVSWASFSSGGISSQYLHQGGGQQLEVKIISSRRQSDTLRHITMGREKTRNNDRKRQLCCV